MDQSEAPLMAEAGARLSPVDQGRKLPAPTIQSLGAVWRYNRRSLNNIAGMWPECGSAGMI